MVKNSRLELSIDSLDSEMLKVEYEDTSDSGVDISEDVFIDRA